MTVALGTYRLKDDAPTSADIVRRLTELYESGRMPDRLVEVVAVVDAAADGAGSHDEDCVVIEVGPRRFACGLDGLEQPAFAALFDLVAERATEESE